MDQRLFRLDSADQRGHRGGHGCCCLNGIHKQIRLYTHNLWVLCPILQGVSSFYLSLCGVLIHDEGADGVAFDVDHGADRIQQPVDGEQNGDGFGRQPN